MFENFAPYDNAKQILIDTSEKILQCLKNIYYMSGYEKEIDLTMIVVGTIKAALAIQKFHF